MISHHQLFLFSKTYRFSSLSADFHRYITLFCGSLIRMFLVWPTLYIFFLELGSELNLSSLILFITFEMYYNFTMFDLVANFCDVFYTSLQTIIVGWLYLDWDFFFISVMLIFLGTIFWVIDLWVCSYFLVGSV